MEMVVTELIRYSHPTKFDHEPIGTVWRMVDEHFTFLETFIQVGEKESDPEWKEIGAILTKAFQEFIHDKEFTKECLRLYLYNKSRPLISISNLIKKKEKEYAD